MSKVVTSNPVRLSYTNLLEPRAQDAEKPDVLTYSTAVLIPKSDTVTLDAIKEALKLAVAEGVTSKWNGSVPSNLRNPLRDGDADKPDDPIYAGHMFFNAKGPVGGKEQPVLLDSKGQETNSVSDIYSGVHARLSLSFYPYDQKGNKGVAVGVNSVLSTGTGDPLGNIVTAQSARADFGVATAASSAASEFSTAPSTGGASEVAAPAADIEDPWAS